MQPKGDAERGEDLRRTKGSGSIHLAEITAITARGRELIPRCGAAADAKCSTLGSERIALDGVPGVCQGVPQSVPAAAEHVITLGRQVRLAYERVDAQLHGDLLRAGTLAFGILRMPVDTSGLQLCTVNDEPLGIVLHGRHPLAGRPALTWTELRGQRLLWFPSDRAPGCAAAVLTRLARMGPGHGSRRPRQPYAVPSPAHRRGQSGRSSAPEQLGR